MVSVTREAKPQDKHPQARGSVLPRGEITNRVTSTRGKFLKTSQKKKKVKETEGMRELGEKKQMVAISSIVSFRGNNN